MIKLRVKEIYDLTEGIKAFDLESANGQQLPKFMPGAHIDVVMGNGLVRQYSLTNPNFKDHYTIGVNRDPMSRGGSAYMHEGLGVGDVIQCSEPRNNFPLNESAQQSVFIAGGIGITPIVSMIRRLVTLKRSWKLYFCTRTKARTPFIADIDELCSRSGGRGQVEYIHDGENGGKPLDVAKVIAHAQSSTHFYCCGPAPLMRAFAESTQSVDEEFLHTEFFSAPVTESAAEEDTQEFIVVLQKTGKRVTVPADKSILEALEAEGIVPFCSCREGICGTCKTSVLDGDPQHNDFVLTPNERKANKSMMLCVSRAYSKEIVLDM